MQVLCCKRRIQSNARVWLPKSKDSSCAYLTPSLAQWPHLEKVVERESALKQLERGEIKNAHFWFGSLPACITSFGALLTFCFILLFTFTIYFHLCFVFAHLLYIFTLLLCKCNCHLNIVFIIHFGIYFHCKLWLFHKYNSTLDFSSSSLHLPLENSMPHRIHIYFSPAT